MVVVMRTVVGLAAIGRSFEFGGKGGRPLFPGEMTLLGELYGEREGLRLPGLGEYRPVSVARQWRQHLEAIESGIRLAQGSRPINRYRLRRTVRPGRPTIRARRSGPSRHAAPAWISARISGLRIPLLYI